jgi:hypothetical protein
VALADRTREPAWLRGGLQPALLRVYHVLLKGLKKVSKLQLPWPGLKER